MTDDVLTVDSIGGLEIVSVTDTDPFINLLVYGDPGVGKTVLAGSAAEVSEMAPVLFIDIEGGTFSLRDRNPDVSVVRVKSWHEMQLVYNELYGMKHGYKTIVLDSLTEMQKFSMAQIMLAVVKKDSDRDPDIPAMRDWGKNIEQIRRMVRGFRDLPIHTVFTALAKIDVDKQTNVGKTAPYLSGKLSSEVAGFLDIVLYMYRKVKGDEVTRYLLAQGTNRQVAKDRSDRLEQVTENPTMQMLYDTIYGVK